jgi:hypothetical protein
MGAHLPVAANHRLARRLTARPYVQMALEQPSQQFPAFRLQQRLHLTMGELGTLLRPKLVN